MSQSPLEIMVALLPERVQLFYLSDHWKNLKPKAKANPTKELVDVLEAMCRSKSLNESDGLVITRLNVQKIEFHIEGNPGRPLKLSFYPFLDRHHGFDQILSQGRTMNVKVSELKVAWNQSRKVNVWKVDMQQYFTHADSTLAEILTKSMLKDTLAFDPEAVPQSEASAPLVDSVRGHGDDKGTQLFQGSSPVDEWYGDKASGESDAESSDEGHGEDGSTTALATIATMEVKGTGEQSDEGCPGV